MSDTQPIRLIIADDHEIMRHGLIALLSNQPDLEIIGQTHNGRGAIEMVRRHKPDIILLDISMEDMTGLEAMRQFLPDCPDVKVLILTIHEEKAFLFEALMAGASGYFLKGSHRDELVHAIQAIHQGSVYLPPKLAGSLVQEITRQQSALPPM